MPTMKDICNQGLGKIGASRVNNLTPPISTLEVKCAQEYPQWKDSEIRKRRWVFATTYATLQALPDQIVPDEKGRTYVFNKPGDLLRAIRPANCTWVQRGEFFYNVRDTLTLEYLWRVPDGNMTDATFIDVLAARVGLECVELASQSPGKLINVRNIYMDALNTAARLNAFILEPHSTQGDDNAYTWDVAHAQPELSGQ